MLSLRPFGGKRSEEYSKQRPPGNKYFAGFPAPPRARTFPSLFKAFRGYLISWPSPEQTHDQHLRWNLRRRQAIILLPGWIPKQTMQKHGRRLQAEHEERLRRRLRARSPHANISTFEAGIQKRGVVAVVGPAGFEPATKRL